EPGAPQAVIALDNVSLDIRRGEFLCLLGPSGCGKSTLLSIIGGLISPTEGTVMVHDTMVHGARPDKIAFVFQESTLFPWYNVAENFGINFKYRGIARSEWRDRTVNALKSVGMADFIDHYPGQLSVGMRQRVNLARGLSTGTEILLMDEPFAALDEQSRLVLGEDLSILLAEAGKTIIFVTHSLAEAVFLSDRIALMTARPGQIKAIIDVNEPHPRMPAFMLQPRFSELRNQCYAALHDEIRQALVAAESGRERG
ncbi:MAG TPA: ABC transporter ATP-binding protein, partial [Micropepsaceae bacterium]|nr:ABC transporter ATP-binding protein [Micropepsaceae bacterium]